MLLDTHRGFHLAAAAGLHLGLAEQEVARQLQHAHNVLAGQESAIVSVK